MPAFLWLLLAAPLIELWFIIRVGAALGAITTIFLLISAGVVGMALLRQQSFNTLLRVDQQLQRGELPAVEILESYALALAAVLLIIPGFLTDLLALPLLVPFVRRWLVRRFLHTGFYARRYSRPQADPFRPQHGDIIDGEWRREDDPRLR